MSFNFKHNNLIIVKFTIISKLIKKIRIVRLSHLVKNKRLTESLILLNRTGISDEAGLLIISLVQRVIKAGRITL